MKRELNELEASIFDLAIIGGGVIGACIARDAARRGLAVALVEMNDFASSASEAMSHTIHGGIRYLAQGRIGLVREALAERAVWLETAPDFVSGQKFLMPLAGGVGALKLKAGIALYQRLGGRRAAFLSAEAARTLEPVLDRPELTGAAVYDDARVDDPDRLIIAMLEDAAAHGAVIANHVECASLSFAGGKAARAGAIDRLSGAQFDIKANHVVNAAGPWAQKLASRLVPGQRQARLTASKGVHILTHPISKSFAIGVSGKDGHGFVMPWKGMSLVGTTDQAFSGDAADTHPSEQEIAQLIEKMTRLLPQASEQFQTQISSFAGVRALPGAAADTYRASREAAVCDHAADGASGLYSVFGGKWTTARLIAENFVNRLAPQFSKPLKPCDTRTSAISASPVEPDLVARLRQAEERGMAVTEDDFCRRVGRADMLAEPHAREEIKAWLASRRHARNSVSGDELRGPS